MQTTYALVIASLFAILVPKDAIAECDQSASRGDWRTGAESREEAETYQTNELADTLEKFLECLEETVPTEPEARASASGGGGGVGGGGNQPSASSEGSEGSEGTSGAGSADGNRSSSPPSEPIETESINLNDSYEKALLAAYREETDPKIKAAMAVEYKKLTGRSIK